jgi:hypothetical protein
MLSTGSTDGRGIVGKVGDFGLSLKMDVHETHISQVFQGTLSHMAPGMSGLSNIQLAPLYLLYNVSIMLAASGHVW